MSCRLRAAALAMACGLLSLDAACAHVVVEPNEGAAGSYVRLAFRVTHGCEGSATVALSVVLPPEVIQARPQPKAGWTIELKRRALDPPVRGPHGREIREAVVQVTWRGGPLPDEHFEEFALALRLPEQPGAILYFPAVQTCERGAHHWIGVPGPGQHGRDIAEPAPALRIQPR